jgi:hypothetical protein
MPVDNSRSYVLGSGGAGQGQGAYQAPYPGTAEHLIDTGLAHNIQAVWWTPMDNIGDLPKFPHIEVQLHTTNVVKLVIGGNGQPGLLRIQLFLLW